MDISTTERYKHIRSVARKYLSSLVSSKGYEDVDPIAVGKLLGMYHRGRKMIFQSETEISVMMDFTLNEKLCNGKSIIDRELEKNHTLNQEQIEILKAYRSGYTSLFQVLGTSPGQNTIQLYDLLRDEDKDIVDIALSPNFSVPPKLNSFTDWELGARPDAMFWLRPRSNDWGLRRGVEEFECALLQRRGSRQHIELGALGSRGPHAVFRECRQICQEGPKAVHRQTVVCPLRLVLSSGALGTHSRGNDRGAKRRG